MLCQTDGKGMATQRCQKDGGNTSNESRHLYTPKFSTNKSDGVDSQKNCPLISQNTYRTKPRYFPDPVADYTLSKVILRRNSHLYKCE